MKKEIPILMYHDISDLVWQPSILPVSPQIFEAQIASLARMKFHFLSLEDYLRQQSRSALSEKSVVITFDDGYKSQISKVLPILKRYDAKAAFFIPTGLIGNPGYMTWDEIRTLKTEGMEIGSHSHSHPWLPGVQDPEKLRWEIRHSKKVLEEELRAPVLFFCYPLGGINELVSREVEQAGYQAAVGTAHCVSQTVPEKFRISRIKVKPHDRGIRFLTKVSGFYNLFRTSTKI